MFEYDWTARFGDTDMFKITFYPKLFEVMHETTDVYLDEIDYPYWRLTEEFGVGLPIVEANAEFSRPVHAGETVTVQMAHDLGDSSVRFEFTAVHEDGVEAFTGFEQRVCVPVDGDGATSVPDELREAMSARA